MNRSMTPWTAPALVAALGLLVPLLGCPRNNDIVDSYIASGPGDVDMLWVVDNSNSMANAQRQLSENFYAFVDGLPPTSTTQIGITTTQAWPCTEDSDPSCDDSVGTAGRLRRYGNAVALMDPADPLELEMFQELVDVGIHGDGFERHLQVALMAICEALELPGVSDFVPGTDDLREDFPFGCTGDDWDPEAPFYEACRCLPLEVEQLDGEGGTETVNLHNANIGLMRGDPEGGSGFPLHVVIVTDEGDSTSTVDALGEDECGELTGEELCACKHGELMRLMKQAAPDLRISVIGPGQGPEALEEEQYFCNDSEVCAVDFLFDATTSTGGVYWPIQVPIEGDPNLCDEAELAPAMADLVQRHPSTEWYRLTLVPDPATLAVTKQSRAVPAYEEGSSCTGAELGTGGWVYEKDLRAVSLVGDCAALPGEIVEVNYTSTGPLVIW